MKVFVAGATGAIGRPLVRKLIEAGHGVTGMTRSEERAEGLRAAGARPVLADVFDEERVRGAMAGARPEVVIHELTSLPDRLDFRDPSIYDATNRVRGEGTRVLVEAARAAGARRLVAQSIAFGYTPEGGRVKTEDDRVMEDAPGAFGVALRTVRAMERAVLGAEGLEGLVLRYGFFYGPGAGTEGLVKMLRARRMVVPRDGGGIVSWIYIEDAAGATVAALERGRAGEAYNIADDEPVSWRRFLDTVAQEFGTPRPMAVPSWILRAMPFVHAVMTSSFRLSNAKAKRELAWTPSAPTYREGIARTARALTSPPTQGLVSVAADVRSGGGAHDRSA